MTDNERFCFQEMTVKGLEPEIQRLIAKHKEEMKKVKSIHEAELLRVTYIYFPNTTRPFRHSP